MAKIIVAVLLMLLAPMSAFAMEQKFSQNGVTTTIKLTPDTPAAGNEVTVSVRVERGDEVITDRQVTLAVYEQGAAVPVITKGVEVLDGDYVDSWAFESPGDYKVVLDIADPQKLVQPLHYEVNVSVGSADDGNGDKHGFLEHHFGGHWGWWGGGMLLMMVPMMILML